MATDIIVPTLGESVTEATVAKWFKAVGDPVAADEALVELETDKVTVEVNAPSGGTLEAISAEEGSEVEVGGVLGSIGEGDGKAKPAADKKKAPAKEEAPVKEAPKTEQAPPTKPPSRRRRHRRRRRRAQPRADVRRPRPWRRRCASWSRSTGSTRRRSRAAARTAG